MIERVDTKGRQFMLVFILPIFNMLSLIFSIKLCDDRIGRNKGEQSMLVFILPIFNMLSLVFSIKLCNDKSG